METLATKIDVLWVTVTILVMAIIVLSVCIHNTKTTATRLSDLIDANHEHASMERSTLFGNTQFNLEAARDKLKAHIEGEDSSVDRKYIWKSLVAHNDRLKALEELCKENKIDVKACYAANSARIDDLEQDRAIIEAIDRLRTEKKQKIRDAVLGDKS